jgi:hypothetical protein
MYMMREFSFWSGPAEQNLLTYGLAAAVSKPLFLQGLVLILERAKRRKGLIQENKVDG